MTPSQRVVGIVSLAALASCSAPPRGKPTELKASELTHRSVVLTWVDGVSGESNFAIERSEASETQGFEEVGLVAADATTFQDENLQPSTSYFYRVSARYADGAKGSPSNVVKITTEVKPTVPLFPGMPKATAKSENDIEIVWADQSDNEKNFELERATAATGPFTQIATPAADATSYTDTGLTKDTSYWYRLRAVNLAGASAYSVIVTAKTFITNDQTAPTVPTAVMAMGDSPTSIAVTWAASTDGESGIDRYELTLNTVANPAYTTMGQSFGFSNLASSTMYCVTVRAVDKVGNTSAFSGMACATTMVQPVGAPSAPVNANATTVNFGSLRLTWSDTSNIESGFEIQRSTTTGAGFAVRATLNTQIVDGGMGVFVDDAGLSPETTYFYRVRAFNDGGFSGFSNEASAATNKVPPAAPTNLTATVLGSNQIRLNWMDNGANEEGFTVEQSTATDGGGFVSVNTPGPNAVQYVATTLSPSTQYFYRVRAFNNGGSTPSAYAGPVNATTMGAPAMPSQLDAGLDAGTIGRFSVRLTWRDNSNDEHGFRIERSNAANGPYTNLLKPDGGPAPAADVDAEEFTVTGLDAGAVYFFRVRAQGDAGFSNQVQATARTLP